MPRIYELSNEKSAEMHVLLRKILGNNLRYIDVRIDPSLVPAPHDNKEDAFVWETSWNLEAVTTDGKTITKNDISAEDQTSISVYFKELGWHIIQVTKQQMPCPWSPGTFNLHCYEGHPSWEYVDGHPNAQGYSYSLNTSAKGVRQIVGILQVKDGDLSIKRVIENSIDLVDWLIILENYSSDDTMREIKSAMEEHDNILLKQIMTVNGGGRFLNELTGTDTVVVQIDADEFWDPSQVQSLKEHLVTEDLSDLTFVHVSNLDVNGIDLGNNVVVGKPGGNKLLYYFGNILAWVQPTERLHGAPMTLRLGVQRKTRETLKLDRPAMLHFPFLDMSSRKREIIRMGIEMHKKSYIEKDPAKWTIQSIDKYNIRDILESIMGDDLITTASETFMFYED